MQCPPATGRKPGLQSRGARMHATRVQHGHPPKPATKSLREHRSLMIARAWFLLMSVPATDCDQPELKPKHFVALYCHSLDDMATHVAARRRKATCPDALRD